MQNTQNNSHKIAIKSSETNRIKNVPFFFVFKTAYNFHVQQRKYIAVDRFIGANSPKCRIAFSYSPPVLFIPSLVGCILNGSLRGVFDCYTHDMEDVLMAGLDSIKCGYFPM